MNIYLLNHIVLNLFIGISALNQTITRKEVKLNDIINLECSQNVKVINNMTNSTLNGFDIFIFKKDSNLVSLFKNNMKIKIENLTDAGLYECGFYRFDKHGSLDYIYLKSWLIRIIGLFFRNIIIKTFELKY